MKRVTALAAGFLVMVASVTSCAPQEDPEFPRPTPAEGNLNDHFAMVADIIPDFGGFYFEEDGSLHVHVLDPDPQRASQIQDALVRVFGQALLTRGDLERRPTPRPAIRLVQAEFTVRDLLRWFEEAERILEIDGVWFMEVDEQANRVTIGVDDLEIEGEVAEVLRELRVPREAVLVKETEPIILDNHTLRSPRMRPTEGGIQIQRQTGGTCTLGFNAARSREEGFLTNSHCTETQGTVTGTEFYNHNVTTQNLLGQERVDPRYWNCRSWFLAPWRACRWSDAAFVRYDGGVEHNRGDIARTTSWSAPGAGSGSVAIDHGNPVMRIRSDANPPFPFKGEMVDKVGRTTGWTYGFVNRTCATVTLSAQIDGRRIRMLCQDRANYTRAGGDSGSSVFLWYGRQVELLGIHWGGSDPGGDRPHRAWFSALWNIHADLGPLTTH